MNFLKPIICLLLVLSLVGCSASKNPNPMIRYGANTATTMAVPGWFVATNGSGRFRAVDVMDVRLFPLKLVALSAAGVGFATGAVLGGTVGFFKWMVNGFEKDHVSDYGSLPEEILPPVKSDENGDNL